MKVSYNFIKHIEPQFEFEAGEYNNISMAEAAQISIAVSLKRIADILESTVDFSYDQKAIRTTDKR